MLEMLDGHFKLPLPLNWGFDLMSLISTSTLQIVCYNSQSRCNQFNTDPEKNSNPAQNEIQPSIGYL